ncbi:DUF3099 domain-containing protein [Stackebrandtia soli]|uniref:DUF3099 domain-containing protein n=1 Tax=Stackebrandtia soli TaxID=1892856 RepID=UPI0039E97E6F
MPNAHEKPALITDAEPSRDEQLRIRQIRYGVMMAIRALLLIVAFILVSVEAPLLWLWLSLCALGMVLLPWMAVLVANDRLPKERHRLSNRVGPKRRRSRTREVTSNEAPEPDESPASRVIDVDS